VHIRFIEGTLKTYWKFSLSDFQPSMQAWIAEIQRGMMDLQPSREDIPPIQAWIAAIERGMMDY
jgi:hypothetical protein